MADLFREERRLNEKASRTVEITIKTRVPSKWRFVDLETGDVWKWDELENKFKKPLTPT